jgi:serine/threonine protein kinase
MALRAGARLGPYEVEHLLGAGGMGEVYRGLDRRLGRAVALKVISQRLVGDDARRGSRYCNSLKISSMFPRSRVRAGL